MRVWSQAYNVFCTFITKIQKVFEKHSEFGNGHVVGIQQENMKFQLRLIINPRATSSSIAVAKCLPAASPWFLPISAYCRSRRSIWIPASSVWTLLSKRCMEHQTVGLWIPISGPATRAWDIFWCEGCMGTVKYASFKSSLTNQSPICINLFAVLIDSILKWRVTKYRLSLSLRAMSHLTLGQ